MMFHLNVEDNNDDVYAYETKPTLVITRLRKLHFTRYCKDTLQRTLMFWCHIFVLNLSEYMYASTNNYSNEERFDRVIAKINGAVFLPHSVVLLYVLWIGWAVWFHWSKQHRGQDCQRWPWFSWYETGSLCHAI